MTRDNNPSQQACTLGQPTEDSDGNQLIDFQKSLEKLSLDEIKARLHELVEDQIELEKENEELRKTQIELEISRSRYFALYDLAPVGYVSLNEEGLIQESNITAANLLGRHCCDLKRKQLTDFILPEDHEVFYHYRRKLLATNRHQLCELRLKKLDGTNFWARLDSSIDNSEMIQEDFDEEANHICRVVITDITENRRLSTQLHEAQKMESVGLLAGGMAHDYNNQLAVIIGYSELALKKKIAPHKMQSFLERILKAALNSAHTTRQLLTFARKQPIDPKIIDLNKIIEGMVEMLAQIVGPNINFVWKPEADLYSIKMDPIQIDQILVNLCINARDASTNHGKITISTKNVSYDEIILSDNEEHSAENYVVLEITDSGCGMSEKILDKIFEPFFTTKKMGRGNGLGLSAVDGIVKQNKGLIKVYSQLGQGTTVQVFLPRHVDNEDLSSLKVSAIKLPKRGQTVLIVENKLAIQKPVEIMLQILGFKTLVADSPSDAIRLATKHGSEIHVLLADIIMKEMSGRELAEKLQPMFPEMEIVFMSGYSANVLNVRGIIPEGMSFIQKPFALKELAIKLQNTEEKGSEVAQFSDGIV